MPMADSSSLPLHDRCFVLARPARDNRSLTDALRRRGATVIACAPFRIGPVADVAALRLALRGAEAADAVVFASAIAVHHAFATSADWRPRGLLVAQGPGTARALAGFGRKAQMPERGFRSEDVLALPALARCRSVVRITGEGGRDWLVRTLRERGIDARDLPVYRRVAAVPRRDVLARIDAAAHPQLVVSSRDTLIALPERFGTARWRRLARHPIIVASDRIGEQARALGARRVCVAASARPADLLAAILASR